MSDDLTSKTCSACVGAIAQLEPEKQGRLLSQLPDWNIIDGHHLQRHYAFKNYKRTLAFVNEVAAVAEAEKHHPNITFTWGKATVEIWTHSVDGLTEADFILAAKIGNCQPPADPPKT
jgi:4a-hydroxytetrahydrobiopterin dehydratase